MDQFPVYEVHPFADIFPLMDEGEFQRLSDDIKIHGQLEPIWIYRGKIIDGRNRYQACQVLGIIPITREWSGEGSLISFVVSLNLHRRHLSESQRAAVAAKVVLLREEENPQICGKVTQSEASKLFNVSERSISSAVKVFKRGIAELGEKVESGELTVSKASEIASLPKGKQIRLIRRAGKVVIDFTPSAKPKKAKIDPIHFCLLCNKKEDLTPEAFINYIDYMSDKLGGVYARCLQNMLEDFVGVKNLPDISDLTERIETAFSYGIHEFNDLQKFTKIPRDVLTERLRVGVANHAWREEEQGGKTSVARGARKKLYFVVHIEGRKAPVLETCGSCFELVEKLYPVGAERICGDCRDDRC